MAAIAAVGVGLAIAAWARWRLGASDPAAWAWPMAAALVCAPVIYPWYLLYFTPFLFTTATLPLAAWTLSIIPTYIVWDMARHGGRWAVPAGLMVAEYGLPCALAACALVLRWRRRPAEHLSAVSRPLSAKTATEATDHLPT
jgi:alpha-1,6-mannosyltransferase